jgi:hypothetical protein
MDIDPVEFGELRATVNQLSKEVSGLRSDVKLLLANMNTANGLSKGVLSTLMLVASAIGAGLGEVARRLF